MGTAHSLTLQCAAGDDHGLMEAISNYTRTRGRCLTYTIHADACGGYEVVLGKTVLMRGRDPLAADGRRCKPNKRKIAGAVHCAKAEIESLSAMSEI